MIVDCHNHIGKGSSGFGDQTPEELKNKLREAEIDKAVVFPKESDDYTVENEKMSKLDEDPFIPFGRACPVHDNFDEELKQIEKLGLHGLKLHPNKGKFRVDKDLKEDLYKLQGELPVLVHTSVSEEERVHNLEILSNLSNPVIIAHAGKEYVKKAVEFINEYENFYLDTSVVSIYRIKRMVTSSPIQKILFGSDSPYSHPKIEKEKILYAVDDDEIRSKILGENILRILHDQ